MTYAIRSDITEKYGPDALYPAADQDGSIDGAKVTQALNAAASIIDSYIGTRHMLPLPTVPETLKRVCIDIAVYEMSPDADTLTDEITARNKAAIAWLKDVSAGRASLGLASPSGRTSARPVVVTGSEKLFSRNSMRNL